ncbi:hypothetical protein F5146DRAFT_253056 [Armillaria mellea]|nr:hypothetical protein F5146DRAFT_253056 [Armillaria mellea]
MGQNSLIPIRLGFTELRQICLVSAGGQRFSRPSLPSSNHKCPPRAGACRTLLRLLSGRCPFRKIASGSSTVRLFAKQGYAAIALIAHGADSLKGLSGEINTAGGTAASYSTTGRDNSTGLLLFSFLRSVLSPPCRSCRRCRISPSEILLAMRTAISASSKTSSSSISSMSQRSRCSRRVRRSRPTTQFEWVLDPCN